MEPLRTVNFYTQYTDLYGDINMDAIKAFPIVNLDRIGGLLVRYPDSSFIPPGHPYHICHYVEAKNYKHQDKMPLTVVCDDEGNYRDISKQELRQFWNVPTLSNECIQEWIRFCLKRTDMTRVRAIKIIQGFFPEYEGDYSYVNHSL